MSDKKRIFIYPNTAEFYKIGGNDYIRKLIYNLQKDFTIVNKQTSLGIFDILFKLAKVDVIYYNWVEDIPERRFGFLQTIIFFIIIIICKIVNIKIVWLVHNNTSHSKKYFFVKQLIRKVMIYTSDLIFSHSRAVQLNHKRNLYFFDHPIESYKPISKIQNFKYDILIWGTVSPYKGVAEFVDFVKTSSHFKEYKILIAGKFSSEEYFNQLTKIRPQNITIINKILSEQELENYFFSCKYVLFTYNSNSVLGSAALSKTLSYGKEIIGPSSGSFKELGDKGLIYNYTSFDSLQSILLNLDRNNLKSIDKKILVKYINDNSWKNFSSFIIKHIHSLYNKPSIL